MHEVQARVLSDIIRYIQDKTGEEPQLGYVLANTAGGLEVTLHFNIGRDYPGMKPGEAEKP
jgi:hypothetical protein